MREIVGFVMGAAAGAAGALFVSSPEGRALLERLRDEARPEVDRASTEWEPVLREVGRAARLAARELESATADLRSRIGELAAALPDETAAPEAASAEAAVVAGVASVEGMPVLPSGPTTPLPAAYGAAAEQPPGGQRRADDTTPGA